MSGIISKHKQDNLVVKELDATEVLFADSLDKKLFEKNFVDLTVTSPPYNVGIVYNSTGDDGDYEDYLKCTKKWLENVYYWTRHTGRLCLNIPLDKNKGGQKSVGADITTIAQKVGFSYHSTIIWNEQNISKRTAWGSWLSASAPYVIAPVELIVILYKGDWKKNRRGESDITKEEFMAWTNGLWTFNGESKKRIGHPAPFPKQLPLRCIKLFSYVGDTVFDPFLGSGTTVLVADNLGRKGVGVEIDETYYNLSINRIEKNKEANMTSQKELLKEFFKNNSNRDINHPEVVDWAVEEWRKRKGEVFRDPDRGIRSLHQEGFLIKVSKGVYRYDPSLEENIKFGNFTQEQKRIIKERYEYRCAVCGAGEEEGVEIHVDHIKPRERGGKSTLDNGQVLCSTHNNFKKHFKQTETGKRMFIALYKIAKENGDKHLQKFLTEVLGVYEKYNINSQIEWKDDNK